jgi:phosphoribosylanthranilate isomerase
MTFMTKICGLSTPETVDAALAGRASHLGFIFFDKSPRHVTARHAAQLRSRAQGRALCVAVTVDADDAMLAEIVSTMRPDVLQLHGKEDPARVAAVKCRFKLPVMKALSVRDAADIARAMAYRGVADRLLFDAKAPEGSELPGGNGVTFDWRLLAALDGDVDYMLSGGLNAGNIAEALRLTHAPGIDVSSGVESTPGVKDVGLIAEFFAAVAAARAQEPADDRISLG